jgi:hypothetical protein
MHLRTCGSLRSAKKLVFEHFKSKNLKPANHKKDLARKSKIRSHFCERSANLIIYLRNYGW